MNIPETKRECVVLCLDTTVRETNQLIAANFQNAIASDPGTRVDANYADVFDFTSPL